MISARLQTRSKPGKSLTYPFSAIPIGFVQIQLDSSPKKYLFSIQENLLIFNKFIRKSILGIDKLNFRCILH